MNETAPASMDGRVEILTATIVVEGKCKSGPCETCAKNSRQGKQVGSNSDVISRSARSLIPLL